MAKLRINNNQTIDGKLSVHRTIVGTGDEMRIEVQGVLETEKYIEEILSIDAPRFSVVDVHVYQEAFGSEEDKILYSFTADSIIVEEEDEE